MFRNSYAFRLVKFVLDTSTTSHGFCACTQRLSFLPFPRCSALLIPPFLQKVISEVEQRWGNT